MATLTNHLTGLDTKTMFRTVAYGRHVLNGFLAKSIVTGSSSSFQITVQQILGRDEWDAIESVYWNNLSIPASDWVAHLGKLTTGNDDPDQGVDTVFDTDVPHNLTPWLRAVLPTNVGEFDTKGSPPTGLQAYARTKKINDYDDEGNVIGYGYSANPARIVADLILRQGRRSPDLIDWPAWVAWRDFCDVLETADYTTLTDFDGFGLTAKYYNGVDFDTFITSRVDTTINYPESYGAPAYGLTASYFSARYEGFIKPKYSETYTIYLDHDDGARLWIDGNLIIDQWATVNEHTATVALTANHYHDIKIEWFGAVAPSRLLLEWSSTSEPRKIVPSKVLYPLAEDVPAYEAHVFFAAPTRLDDAVRTVLNLCNSTVQKVNGKYRFFCFEQITESSFDFTEENIKSIVAKPRDKVSIRNSFSGEFRDLRSRFLEKPLKPFVVEKSNLIDLAGRIISGQDYQLFNMTRWQAYKVLTKFAARECDTLPIDITGNASTFPVLPGDRVTVTSEIYDWVNKEFLVLTANDSSAEETADERTFTLIEWVD